MKVRLSGRRITMSKAIEEKNKALVLEAFDTPFNQHYLVVSDHSIQTLKK
jgi:hypothetical protein